MAFESEEVMFEGPRVLEMVSGPSPYKVPVVGALYKKYSGEDELKSCIVTLGTAGYEYPVPFDEISIDEEKGTIEFDALEASYRIRKFEDSDSEWFSNGTPLTKEMMEGVTMALEETGKLQTLEALVNSGRGNCLHDS